MNISKLLFLFIVILSFAGILTAQSDTTDVIKFSDRKPADIEMEAKLVPSKYSEIGYAYCYYFDVQKVIKGKFKDDRIILTVLAGEEWPKGILDSGTDSEIYVLRFLFNKSNEEYNTAYITGFVDSGKNSWRLVSVNKKN